MSFNQLIIQQGSVIQRKLTAPDFDLSHWRQRADSIPLAGGRDASQKVEIDGGWYVLREYRRGGMVARLVTDQYIWTGLTASRPYREEEVVKHALRNALPVAEVAGYRIQTCGLFYRAAILSCYIDNQGTLADYISTQALAPEYWYALGKLIRRLHLACISHADLNANNILLTSEQNFYLIDFDKARVMPQQGRWARQSLLRLQRSLKKIQASRAEQNLLFSFNDGDWQSLLDGYK